MRKTLLSTMGIATLLMVMSMTSLVQAHFMCPFCSAINLTFAEQMSNNDVVVIAKVINIPPPVEDVDAELPKSQFEITQVLKGQAFVGAGMKFKTLLVGKYELNQEFLVMGADPPNVVWTVPMKASDRVVNYLEQLNRLPAGGADRLEFFQKYFEDKESVLAFDAYDEFAKAPYQDLIDLKDRMPREQIIKWILDPETSVNRRRLYFTMLGVCGEKEDIETLEELIKSGDRKKQAGLDALIACYLNLKKVDGVDLIEEQFITNKECDYVDTLAAVSALRFHGTEVDFVPKERIVKAIRQLLDRPKMADMIIPDLARWEDWTVMDKLVQMFKDADEETNWLRVPVVNYLRACPNPDAKKHIEVLRKIDPDAVRRAEFFADFDDAGFDEDDEAETDQDESTEGGDDDSDDLKQEPAPSVSTSVPVSTLVTQVTEIPVTVRKVQLDGPADDHEDTKTTLPLNQVDELESPADQDEDSGVQLIPAEVATSPNRESVETVSNTMAAPDVPAESPRVAQQQPEVAPIAQSSTVYNHSWGIIFIPMLSSAVIFVLLWSVFHGWFQRLIF